MNNKITVLVLCESYQYYKYFLQMTYDEFGEVIREVINFKYISNDRDLRGFNNAYVISHGPYWRHYESNVINATLERLVAIGRITWIETINDLKTNKALQ